jgi:hypothetical protein
MYAIRDLGDQVDVKVITIDNDATAASTGDATEVDGAETDLLGYSCGKIVISYVTTLTADKTLSFGVQKSDCDTSGGSYSADAVIQASTVAETGALTAEEGVVEIDVDLSGYQRYVKFKITPDLSHTSADTVTWSAVFLAMGKDSQ